MGIEVVEAADGREALERLKEMSFPDVVLVDWNMPVMSGIDFIRAVRELHIYDPLPLIMVTTNSECDYVGVRWKQAPTNTSRSHARSTRYVRSSISLASSRHKSLQTHCAYSGFADH